MCDDDELRFEFRGPTPDERKAFASSPKMLSEVNLLRIIVRGWTIGRYQITNHFREMSRLRGFDILDAENAIKRGALRGEPEYCPDYSNWKCRILGPAEGKKLEVVLALDDFEDYVESPLIVPITGYWRK